ncbi:MAG TPA: hypothetical protein VNI20_07915, partial [Fimbriimonadaceae bacterium]|nr:hypothetical protein [Fimbriimonadaceae bacterium]
ALSKQTGVYLGADPNVGDVPILVSVKSARLTDLLSKIADAVGGTIKEESGGYRLIYDQDARRKEANTERQLLTDAFKKGIDNASKRAEYLGRWDAKTVDNIVAAEKERRDKIAERFQQRNLQAGDNQTIRIYDSSSSTATPAMSAAYEALAQISPSLLASIGPGDRVVFSTSPNRMQRRMPINAVGISNNFYANYNLVAQRASDLKTDSNVQVIGGLTTGDPIRGISETHLILSRSYRSQDVTVTIKFVDMQGLYVGEGSVAVVPDFGTVAPGQEDSGKAIQLSETSRQMAVLMAQELQSGVSDRMVYTISTNGNGGAVALMSAGTNDLPKIIPPDLFNILLNPDKFDPASLYVSEAFIQTAQAKDENLIATFPDSIVTDMARLLVKGKTTTDTLLSSCGSMGMTVSQQDGWMVATPTWPNNARETRFDRRKTATLLKSVNTRGYASLEDLADYSLSLVTGTSKRPLDMVYLNLINSDVYRQLDNYVQMNFDLLRLYATLPDAYKYQSGDDVHTAYQNLPGTAKGFAERAVFNKSFSGMFNFNDPGAGKAVAIQTITQGVQKNSPPANSVMNEPTEALPNGIPSDADISLTRKVSDAVFASQKGVRGGKFYTAAQLGLQRGLSNRANFPERNFDSYSLGQVADVHLNVVVGQETPSSALFEDGTLLNTSRPLSYDQLPDTFRSAVEKFADRFNGQRGRGGGG